MEQGRTTYAEASDGRALAKVPAGATAGAAGLAPRSRCGNRRGRRSRHRPPTWWRLADARNVHRARVRARRCAVDRVDGIESYRGDEVNDLTDKMHAAPQGPLPSCGESDELRNAPVTPSRISTRSARGEMLENSVDTEAGSTASAHPRDSTVNAHDGDSRLAGSPALLKAAIRNVAGLLSSTAGRRET